MSLLQRIERAPGNDPIVPGAPSEEKPRTSLSSIKPPANKDLSNDLKSRVQSKLIAELDPGMDLGNAGQIRRIIEDLFNAILEKENVILTRSERNNLFEQIAAEILAFGPIQPLLQDDSVTEIMVNGPNSVYVERKGKIQRTGITFQNEEHVLRIIDRIISPLGRRCDESQPMVDARLPDGSRVNAVIAPISLVGPVLTIRKFARVPLTAEDLVTYGTWSAETVEFLKGCVSARLNVVVSGGTGSGKTTLLNILSSFIPDDERIVTIEDAAELQLRQQHVITMESRPANVEGKGRIGIRDLVMNALRMRPDRIVVGECRGAEAIDMLQAMNTGHDGSLTTAHSNSPRDTLSRLETMVLMAGMDLPLKAIREQIASAVDLIVHEERMRDGTRRVVNITEVQGLEGDVIVMQDIFTFEQSGFKDGVIEGRLKPSGIRPKFTPKLQAANINLPPSIFGLDVYLGR